ncbi:MAG TPA: hypothetical protein VLU73_14780 [Methylococcaceae bacterium]|jgi:hypothetical protein|nr:hypothetical protein [Methylococcaceae bacterium]
MKPAYHPSLVNDVAFGGPLSSCVRHGADFASQHDYHNDRTPLRLPYVLSPSALSPEFGRNIRPCG